jgi:Uncharacterised protein family UPF0102
MATNQEKGKKGEELASAWLLKKGYVLLHRNWRHARFEIDIKRRYPAFYRSQDKDQREVWKPGRPG